MGLEIKRHKGNGKLKLTSTVSGERLHDEQWISVEAAKRILIDQEFFRFMENIAKIGMDFPAHRIIDGKLEPYPENHLTFNRWYLNNDCKTEPLYKKVIEISDELNIGFLQKLFEDYPK